MQTVNVSIDIDIEFSGGSRIYRRGSADLVERGVLTPNTVSFKKCLPKLKNRAALRGSACGWYWTYLFLLGRMLTETSLHCPRLVLGLFGLSQGRMYVL